MGRRARCKKSAALKLLRRKMAYLQSVRGSMEGRLHQLLLRLLRQTLRKQQPFQNKCCSHKCESKEKMIESWVSNMTLHAFHCHKHGGSWAVQCKGSISMSVRMAYFCMLGSTFCPCALTSFCTLCITRFAEHK